jgi:hypothetical protein
MDKVIAHFILSKILLLLCVGVAAPVWYPATRIMSTLEDSGQQQLLVWTIRVSLLLLLIGLYWLSKRMSYHMTIEGKSFGCGVMEGFREARLHLAFLPLVGHWFMPDEDNRDFEKDE